MPALSVTGLILAPESPRWLIAVGRNEEASAIFVKYHAGGDQNSVLVEFEMAEVEQTVHLEEAAAIRRAIWICSAQREIDIDCSYLSLWVSLRSGMEWGL
jgi:hypothetical protein